MIFYVLCVGMVVYCINWQGEKKKVGDSVWCMEKILQILDFEMFVVCVFVDEVYVGLLFVGQCVML